MFCLREAQALHEGLEIDLGIGREAAEIHGFLTKHWRCLPYCNGNQSDNTMLRQPLRVCVTHRLE